MSTPYEGDSTTQFVPGVKGTNAREGIGLLGQSVAGYGVMGEGGPGTGSDALGYHNPTVGVVGKTISENSEAYGVYGEGTFGAGVRGYAAGGDGVQGASEKFAGVSGQSRESTGVRGTSSHGEGVHGETESGTFAAVAGIQLNRESSGAGVYGEHHGRGPAGFFKSDSGEGVHGETSGLFAAVAGIQLNPRSTGAGIYGEHRGEGPAGFFRGNVVVTKDIILTNADCAEEFDFCAGIATLGPGTVTVIDDEGFLRGSEQAYDKRVAGVISGAGSYKPAIILDRQESPNTRLPVALVGKVYCKVDAQYAPITFGDLLTSSSMPGHAMKACDPLRAFGAVIGKALGPLKEGQGLIPILIALQ